MGTDGFAEIFNKTYKEGALIFSPANDMEISRCLRDLESLSIPALPDEYIRFLRLVNGYAWNGFEFFGYIRSTHLESDVEHIRLPLKNPDTRWLT